MLLMLGWWSWGSGLVGSALNVTCDLLRLLAHWGAEWDFLRFHVGFLPLWLVLLFYALLVVIKMKPAVRIFPRALLLVLGLIALGTTENIRPRLTLVMLDVGQGDALFLRTPHKNNWLVDAGPAFRGRDMGKERVVPFLEIWGIDHLRGMVLTHNDLDHLGGAAAVLRRVSCDTLYYGSIRDHPAFRELLRLCGEREIPMRRISAGTLLWREPGFRLRVLAPAAGMAVSGNNASLVLQAVFGETSVLLTGDAEKEEEAGLLVYGDLLQSELLKVGHHGSRTSSSAAFLELVHPRWALISCGRNNHYGHPHGEVLDRFRKLGIGWYRTDKQHGMLWYSNGQKWFFQAVRPVFPALVY
jgi:competence protein ComEC